MRHAVRAVRGSTNGLSSAAARRVLSTLGRPQAPLLFTPGPLTTTLETKAPGQRDYGSRETSFLGIVRDIRAELLALGGVSAAEGYASVIVPGSGTFGIESVLGSVVPRGGGRVLIAVNGAYGRRLGLICDALSIPHVDVVFDEREAVDTGRVMATLARERGITHVACVHHETTAGVLNPVGELGRAIRAAAPEVAFIVDSMSAFGAYPAHLSADGIAFLISSSNKCIEGVPGFSFVLCERRRLEASAGNARSLSLDLHAQWAGLEANGQFRFTPPTHAIAMFHAALQQHKREGGSKSRLEKYTRNFAVLKTGLAEMGFSIFVPDGPSQGVIISTFLLPDDPKFNFDKFYDLMSEQGCIIYPGKLTKAACFRIGNIGALTEADMHYLVQCVRVALGKLGVSTPVKQIQA